MVLWTEVSQSFLSFVTDYLPAVVSEMIKTGLSSERGRQSSFWNIFETLKQPDFTIMSAIDSANVLALVDWVEFLEQFHE
jgi:hypothetical protein